MGRREERDAVQSTWMVMREPQDRDGNRRTRRARVAQVRGMRTFNALAKALIPDDPVSVRAAESSEVRGGDRPAARDSAAPTEES